MLYHPFYILSCSFMTLLFATVPACPGPPLNIIKCVYRHYELTLGNTFRLVFLQKEYHIQGVPKKLVFRISTLYGFSFPMLTFRGLLDILGGFLHQNQNPVVWKTRHDSFNFCHFQGSTDGRRVIKKLNIQIGHHLLNQMVVLPWIVSGKPIKRNIQGGMMLTVHGIFMVMNTENNMLFVKSRKLNKQEQKLL